MVEIGVEGTPVSLFTLYIEEVRGDLTSSMPIKTLTPVSADWLQGPGHHIRKISCNV